MSRVKPHDEGITEIRAPLRWEPRGGPFSANA